MNPSTQPKSVVCNTVNPNDDTIIERWFVREFGMLSKQEKRAKIQVFGSLKVSIILKKVRRDLMQKVSYAHCSTLKCLFSTPAWFSLIRLTAMARSSCVRNQALVGESGKKYLFDMN